MQKIASGGGKRFIPLGTLLHKTLNSAEKLLGTVMKKSPTSFGSRAALQKALMETKILISRLLVIMKWYNETNQHESLTTILSSPGVLLSAYQTELNDLMDRLKLKELERPEELPDETPESMTVRPADAFSKLLLNNSGTPKRIKFMRIHGRQLVLSAPNEYTVNLRADRRGVIHLKSYTIAWPKNFEFPEPLLTQLTVLLKTVQNQKVSLHITDRILHMIYTAAKFAVIAQGFAKHCRSYGAKLTFVKDKCQLIIEFPSFTRPPQAFEVSIRMGNVVLSSCKAMHIPQNVDGENVMEVFDRYNSFDQPPGVHHGFITHILDVDCDIEKLLSDLRSRVIATDLCEIYQMMIHTVRSVSMPYVCIEKCVNYKMVSLGKISTRVNDFPIFTLSVESGRARVAFEYATMIQDSFHPTCYLSSCTEVTDLTRMALNNLIHAVAALVCTKCTFNISKEFGEFSPLFARSFSFAPDFYLNVATIYGRPVIEVMDNTGKKYNRPELVHYESLSAEKAWRSLFQMMIVSKRIMFLAQVQKYLTEVNIRSVMNGDRLQIEVAFCRDCTLKASQHGWKLRLVPLSAIFQSETEPISELTGSSYTSRCGMLIAKLIRCFDLWKCGYHHINIIARESPGLCVLIQSENQVSIRFTDDRLAEIALSFGKNITHVGDINCSRYLHCPWNFQPTVDVTCAKDISLSRYFREILESRNAPGLAAFIRHGLVAAVEFFRVFGKKDSWTFTDIIPAGTQLVYKGKYTLLVSMIPHHMFVFRTPLVFPSVALTSLLTSLQKKYDPTYQPTPRTLPVLNCDMGHLEAVRDRIQEFCARTEILERYGFTFYSSREDNVMAAFRLVHQQHSVVADVDDDGVTFSLKSEGENTDTSSLKEIVPSAVSDYEFIEGFAHLIKEALPKGRGSLNLALSVLVHFKRNSGNQGDLVSAMKSVLVDNALHMEFVYRYDTIKLDIYPQYGSNYEVHMTTNGSNPVTLNKIEDVFTQVSHIMEPDSFGFF